MKKNGTKILLILAILLGSGGLSYSIYQDNVGEKSQPSDTHPELVIDRSGVTLVRTLSKDDGTLLGDIYVTYVKDSNIFTSLLVSREMNGKNIIIYKINNEGFFNTKGKELDFAPGDFYGLEFLTIGDDFFALHALANSGKEVSDDVIIRWNDDKGTFGVSAQSLAEMGSILVHTFKTPEGLLFGKMYATYTDEGILSSLDIMKEMGAKEEEIYMINSLGFYNTVLGTKDLSTTGGEFLGFQLSLVQDDSFIVRVLSRSGEDISNEVMVKWNYEKGLFEVQKIP